MKRLVLIVDDNQEMLFTLKDGLEKYAHTFSVMISGDGVDAVRKIQQHLVSVVVTDLKMPRMDGISLLSAITTHYPGTPVIVMTGYITDHIQDKALHSGAVDYIEKPFLVDDLAAKIIAVINHEADGGKLQNVTPSIFLQLVAAEEKTCTIRLSCCTTGRSGVLFFQAGKLVQARCAPLTSEALVHEALIHEAFTRKALTGEAAAYEIFSWDAVDLAIQNQCAIQRNAINKDVQALYLEALRRKDESEADPIQELTQELADPSAPAAVGDAGVVEIRQRIESQPGLRSGVEDIYQDHAWAEPLSRMTRLGDALTAGPLRLAYVNRAESVDYIVLPGDPIQVVSIHPKSPRDRLMEALLNPKVA
ncbi:MAG: response regulator [Desulfosarcinaceae bacterium]|jgi:CheY-like chemotaxis protein